MGAVGGIAGGLIGGAAKKEGADAVSGLLSKGIGKLGKKKKKKKKKAGGANPMQALSQVMNGAKGLPGVGSVPGLKEASGILGKLF